MTLPAESCARSIADASALPMPIAADARGQAGFALWSIPASNERREFIGPPTPTTHLIAMGLSSFSAECFKDGRQLRRRNFPYGYVQIMEAGVTPRAILPGKARFLHAYVPTSLFEETARDAGCRAMPQLLDPEGDIIPHGNDFARQLAIELTRPMTAVTRLWLDGATLQLLALLLRSCVTDRVAAPVARGGLTQRNLRIVRDYLDAHLAEDLAMETLARIAGQSPKHFARAFRQSTGMPPHRYVLMLRVERARALLESSDLPLAEITFECGFSDQSHFTATFHRLVGMTPGQYRRERRN